MSSAAASTEPAQRASTPGTPRATADLQALIAEAAKNLADYELVRYIIDEHSICREHVSAYLRGRRLEFAVVFNEPELRQRFTAEGKLRDAGQKPEQPTREL
jgi:hypothetical protein